MDNRKYLLLLILSFIPMALSADSWIGVSNKSSSPLRFFTIVIRQDSVEKVALLRSLPIHSKRVWFRVPGDKPFIIGPALALTLNSLATPSVPLDDSLSKQPGTVIAGVYHLDIDNSFNILIKAAVPDSAVQEIRPFWDVNIVVAHDRLEVEPYSIDINKENRIVEKLISQYTPSVIPKEYTKSPALMSIYTLGYQHGWLTPAITGVELKNIDYLKMLPLRFSVANVNELVTDDDERSIFQAGFDSGFRKASLIIQDK